MALAAKGAMLAAVEIYNKTVFEYREETFCVLMSNAWEVLLKAEILRHADERLTVLYLPKKDRKYPRAVLTGNPRTIDIGVALNRVGLPDNVRENVRHIVAIRNEIVHFGPLTVEMRNQIREYGTASVRNFIRLIGAWFGESVEEMYLLPVALVGPVTGVPTRPDARQRRLLYRLRDLAAESSSDPDGYAVSLRIEMEVVATGTGGGSIGITRDPAAPRVQLSDEEFRDRYPAPYKKSLIPALNNRYVDFKRGPGFNDHMREVNDDPRCAYTRLLNPSNPKSSSQRFYNLQAVFEVLDEHYTLR